MHCGSSYSRTRGLPWFAVLVGVLCAQPTVSFAQKSKPIQINGSSTVYPISQAWAEDFQNSNKGITVAVGEAGTTGGFKKFIAGESDINNASRPITPEEKKQLADKNIEWIELNIAIDGLTVAVNPKNTWCNELTVGELKKLWEPDSTVKMWSDIRPNWPKEKITLYGPGPDSGTFDYFTEAICKTKKKCRTDYTPSEDDNILVQGVNNNKFALGYFGFSYYVQNSKKLKAVGIGQEVGGKFVLPTQQTVISGEYVPLSRPLFMYVRKDSLKRPEVAKFLQFALGSEGQALVSDPTVNYIQIPADTLKESQRRLAEALK